MIELKNLQETYNNNDLFYWCNAIGEINMPGDGFIPIIHDTEDLPPRIRKIYEDYWTAGGDWNYVITYRGTSGIGICYPLGDSWIKNTLHTSSKTLKMYCKRLLEGISNEMQHGETSLVDNYHIFYGAGTDPCGDELLVFIPESMLDSLPEFRKQIEKANIYITIEHMAFLDYLKRIESGADEFQRLLNMCGECDLENCAYHNNGICRYPMVDGKKPSFSKVGDANEKCLTYLEIYC